MNIPRAMSNLNVDGTDALKYGLARKAKFADDPSFSSPDAAYGAKNEKERPHPYARATRLGQKSIRNQQASEFSIPETTLEQLRAEESGVTFDQEDLTTGIIPRNHV